PHRLQFLAPVKVIGLLWRLRPGLPVQERPGVLAVDRQLRQRGPREAGERRQDVDRHPRLVLDAAGRHDARPTDDARLPYAAFPTRTLALAERAGRTAVVAVAQPRAVVR